MAPNWIDQLSPTIASFYAGPYHEAVVRNSYFAPTVAVVVYMLAVFYVLPRLRPAACRPFWRHSFAAWNMMLSIFSTIGVIVCLPYVVHVLRTKGLRWAVCSDDLMWGNSESIAACNGSVAIMMTAFMFSKFPELLDTFFLVWMKKPVAFLHWYHHITVLLYCWFAYRNATPTAVLFGTMNYIVHSVMYLYFALALYTKALGFMRLPITLLQLSQMGIGVALTIITYYFDRESADCSRTYASSGYYYFCTALYGSYLVLFAKLFIDNYVVASPRQKRE